MPETQLLKHIKRVLFHLSIAPFYALPLLFVGGFLLLGGFISAIHGGSTSSIDGAIAIGTFTFVGYLLILGNLAIYTYRYIAWGLRNKVENKTFYIPGIFYATIILLILLPIDEYLWHHFYFFLLPFGPLLTWYFAKLDD